MKEDQSFEMWAGESREITCTVTDEDTSASVDLTGASVSWVLQTSLGGTTLLTKSTANTGACGITVSGCTFSFYLVHADTDAIAGPYYHEAEVIDTSGCYFKPMRGYINVNKGAI